MRMRMSVLPLLFLPLLLAAPLRAQETPATGPWKGSLTAALSVSSGNTDSNSLNLAADAERKTDHDKLSLYGKFLRSRAESTLDGVVVRTTTAYQWSAGTRYDRNLTPRVFGFGGLDLSHDEIRRLDQRSALSAGLGYHLLQQPEHTWDVYAGLSRRADRYLDPGVQVNDVLRTRYAVSELLLGEESSHALTESTRLKQKLVIIPALDQHQGTRATFDAGLQVALNKTMSLSVSLQRRYDGAAQAPLEKSDTLLLTGLNVKFGG